MLERVLGRSLLRAAEVLDRAAGGGQVAGGVPLVRIGRGEGRVLREEREPDEGVGRGRAAAPVPLVDVGGERRDAEVGVVVACGACEMEVGEGDGTYRCR